MAFQPIRRILPGAVHKAGISRQVEATRVLDITRECLMSMWGPEKASMVDAVSFANGELRLLSNVPAAIQELRMWDVRLRNEINRQLEGKIVHTLRIMHG
jgi:hypothetical protein